MKKIYLRLIFLLFLFSLSLKIVFAQIPIPLSITPSSGSSNVNETINFTTVYEFELGSENINYTYIWIDVYSPEPVGMRRSFHGILNKTGNEYKYYGVRYDSTINEDCGGGCTEKCCVKNYVWDVGGFTVGSQDKIYIYNDTLYRDDTQYWDIPDLIAEWRVVRVTPRRSRLEVIWEVTFKDFFFNKNMTSFLLVKATDVSGNIQSSGWYKMGSWNVTFQPDPCRESGTFCPPGATGTTARGYCVDRTIYNSFNFRPLTGSYSCGSNFCCVACADDNCCKGLRGFCYDYSVNSPTGCSAITNGANTNCADAGGTFCRIDTSGGTVLDPPTGTQPRYGPVRCVQVITTTTTRTTTPTQTTPTQTTPTQTTPTASTTTTPTTTTVSTTTTTSTTTASTTTTPTTTTATTTTIGEGVCGPGENCRFCTDCNSCVSILQQPWCGWCRDADNCGCKQSKDDGSGPEHGSCDNWYFKLDSCPGEPECLGETTTPVTTTSRETVTTTPKATTTTSSQVTLNLVCPSTCYVGKSCSCEVSGCDSGVFIAKSYQGNPISGGIIEREFSRSPSYFNFPIVDSGVVRVNVTCSDPIESSVIKTINSVAGTKTTPRITTTISGKEPCPTEYECCVNDPNYEDEPCAEGFQCCKDHTCRTTCPRTGGSKLILIGLFIIVVGVVVFVLSRVLLKKKEAATGASPPAWPFPRSY